MSNGDLWVEPDRLPDQLDAALRPPCLEGNDSEKVQRIEVIGLLLQNSPIDALRIRQFSLLVQRQSLLEFGLQSHGSRLCPRSKTS